MPERNKHGFLERCATVGAGRRDGVAPLCGALAGGEAYDDRAHAPAIAADLDSGFAVPPWAARASGAAGGDPMQALMRMSQ